MTVLLLDDRWPTLIPLEAFGQLSGPVVFTDDVPAQVRCHFDTFVSAGGEEVLVSTNDADPQVRARIDAGDLVIEAPSRHDPVRQAVRVMSRARSVGAWEATQTHRSLLPYLAEESQEFADAVVEWEDNGEESNLLKELGDVLLQVFFHAEIASQRGAFDFDDVAGSFVDKLRSRSPYLFDESVQRITVDEQERLWAQGKAQERETSQELLLAGEGEEEVAELGATGE